MRIFKNHPLLSLVNGYLIDAPQPSNLSYLWNFGSLLAIAGAESAIVLGILVAFYRLRVIVRAGRELLW